MNILNKMAPIQSRTMSGYFNDMDGLEVGNGGQNDDEYVTHFSMWAMMSSPLLMGTNVKELSPANLAILSNPAVIALNQDPSAAAGSLIWRDLCNDFDEWGQCERAMWVRSMSNGDMVVALINGGNSSIVMNATLSSVFIDDSTAGTSMPAPELSETWRVFDLWSNRMSNAEAAMVINSTASPLTVASNSTTRYNATRTSYATGLMNNETALFGTQVGTIAPSGTWLATIPRHSTGLYRLRKAASSYSKRDEL